MADPWASVDRGGRLTETGSVSTARLWPDASRPRRADPLHYVVKVNLTAAVVGLAFFALAVWCCWRMFAPFVDPLTMALWLYGSVAFLLFWLAAAVAMIVRRPGDMELVRVFAPIGMAIRIGSNLIVLATIWLFLPVAPPALMAVMTTFYCAHVATQVLAMPAAARANALGVFAVLGSLVAVTLMNDARYAAYIATFVAAYAVVLMLLGHVNARLIGNVIEQRRTSDESAVRLAAALDAVAEERDAKTRFIASASHDLGQPLQAANLFFSQLVRATTQEQRDRAAEGMRRAFAASEQLLAHMLHHLRLEADAVTPVLAPLHLPGITARVGAQFVPAAEAADIALSHAAHDLSMMADRILLERALSNLIDNAIRHSGARRVLIAVRRGAPGRVRIWVIDNGLGMSAADARHAFDEYFRGSGPAAAQGGGFGLGLPSVRRLATLLGGEADQERRWVRGSAFYLDFPRYIAPVAHRDSAAAA